MAHNVRSESENFQPVERHEFREITDAYPDGVVIVNSTGQILFVNPGGGATLRQTLLRAYRHGVRLSGHGFGSK